MNVSIKDASQYFRGLLILIRRDGIVTARESDAVARLGARLGFDHDFCARAIEEILVNTHIDEMPPVFGSADLAGKFIKDAIRVASTERTMTEEEGRWLEMTADLNGCDKAWFRRQCELAARTIPAQREWEFDSVCVIHGSLVHGAAGHPAHGGSPC